MADPRERYEDQTELFRLAADSNQASLWTSMPGIIQSYSAAAQTVTVQPATQANVQQTDGTTKAVKLPLLVDVPVQFPAGGGHSLTFPVAKGDECLVIIASRCIDGWWKNGGVQPQLDMRMHDLSDGMALLGFRSQPRVLANVSTATVQIRSDDGMTHVDVNGSTKALTLTAGAVTMLLDGTAGTIGFTAPNGFVFEGPTLAATGEITRGFGTADQVTLGQHKHAGGPTPTPGT